MLRVFRKYTWGKHPAALLWDAGPSPDIWDIHDLVGLQEMVPCAQGQTCAGFKLRKDYPAWGSDEITFPEGISKLCRCGGTWGHGGVVAWQCWGMFGSRVLEGFSNSFIP